MNERIAHAFLEHIINRMNWKDTPPYNQIRVEKRKGTEQERFQAKYRSRCFCGAVEFEVCADPVDAKICHCYQCQLLHGAPFQWAVIFHKSDVRFVRGVNDLYFYNSELGQAAHILPCKLSCKLCRSPIADEGRRMFLAFGPLFDFGSPARIPSSFRPTCHIFYDSRTIDINDDIPKYLGHKGSSPLWDGKTSHNV